jgi:hydroxyacylglutathione hydrolase
MMMNLIALPAFTDNYIWMLHDGAQAVVVDPGDAGPVRQALQDQGLTLAGILVTHHHPDHTGGVAELHAQLREPAAQVFAPARERTPEPHVAVSEGDVISVAGLRFRVLEVPGHTAGHVAYVHEPANGAAPLLFCGDTLFSGGCGRLFEGTPRQMHDSLARLAALPGATQVCCTHEYTLSNLRFATDVEPGNAELATYRAQCEALRANGQPTLPSTIARERAINPFLRCDVPAVQAAAQAHGAAAADGVSVFAALREWKNHHR